MLFLLKTFIYFNLYRYWKLQSWHFLEIVSIQYEIHLMIWRFLLPILNNNGGTNILGHVWNFESAPAKLGGL